MCGDELGCGEGWEAVTVKRRAKAAATVVQADAEMITVEQRDARWCVVLESGAVHCFDTQQEAQDLVRSFAEMLEEDDYEDAAEGEPMPDMAPAAVEAPVATGRQWRGVLAMEGSTDDGRFFESFDWRQLPLSLMTQLATPANGPHEGAQVSARIDWIEKHGRAVLGGGVFNDDEFGQYAADRLEDGSLTGVSIDAVGVAEYRCTEYDTTDPSNPQCVDVVLAFPKATICAATQLATPAFAAATLEMVPADEPPEMMASALVRLQAAGEALLPPDPPFPQMAENALALVAHAGRPTEIHPPVEPPPEWFNVPEPDVYTPMHINAEGMVCGHVAPWGVCHTGYPGACVTAPPSPSDYAVFTSSHGQVVCNDGSTVRTGPVTLTTSHADEHMDVGRTLSHYDNSGCAIGDVVVRAGVWGPWACGAARPTLTPAQIREFNASAPSGDWRPLRGGLDLVAVLMVNTPGFPPLVAAGVRVDEGGKVTQESLILTGTPAGSATVPVGDKAIMERVAALEAKVARMEPVVSAVFAQLEPQIFEELRASIEG
jgi:hypothetical protein